MVVIWAVSNAVGDANGSEAAVSRLANESHLAAAPYIAHSVNARW